jgi:hypothetical protein
VRAPVTGSLLTVLAGLVVSGCASDTTATTEMPACADAEHGTASNAVVLMAQSVPTASYVPCLRTALPLGWRFHHLDARNDVSVFSLDSDRDGQEAIKVRLEASCDTEGATEILSDREGLQRFERVRQTTPHFEGERYYRFEGGCITFEFRLTGQSRGEPLALTTQAVGTISRADLIDQVHEESDGRLSLDPTPAADGEP